jgi:hypothetical protein
MISIFSPDRHSHPVNLVEQNLGLTDAAIVVPFESVADAKELNCFDNVRAVVAEGGGEFVYGWLVWQHGNIFVEAEHHAVWRKPTGEVVCVTPQNPPVKAVTFIPDPSATYDFNTRPITNNIRIALLNDSRLQQVFRAEQQKTEIINAAKRSNPLARDLVGADAAKYRELELKKSMLMAEIVMSQFSGVPSTLSKMSEGTTPARVGLARNTRNATGRNWYLHKEW